MSEPLRPAGREQTFRSLYEATYADVLRFVQRRVGAEHAEDVVADTFLVVWRRLRDLPADPEDARAWTFGVARNVLLTSHRGEQRRRALGVRLAETTPTTADDTTSEGALSRVQLGRAWRLLSARHQEALALAAFDGLDAPRAAEVLGISPVAFRLRLSRARRALRMHLDHLPCPDRASPAPAHPEFAHPERAHPEQDPSGRAAVPALDALGRTTP